MLYPPGELQNGDRVLLQGLKSKPQLNGSVATVLSFDSSTERYQIKLLNESRDVLAIKRANLALRKDACCDNGGSVLPLPDFCVRVVCQFLQAFELLVVGCVNTTCRAEADCNTVWKTRCTSAWQDRRGLLCIPQVRCLDDILATMKVRELKRRLQLNDVKMSGFRERQEFVSAVRSTLLSQNSPSLKTKPPMWMYSMDNWKASYFFMQVDRKRTKISTDELCDEHRHWTWRFDENSQMAGHTIQSKFMPDGSYQSSYRDGQNRSWNFLDGIVGGSGSTVQVGDYPSLFVSRSKDWGWMMHNQYGYFTEEYNVA